MPELFLDTSIQIDRIVMEESPDIRPQIDALLKDFNFLLACSYSRLEFKRVVLQNLALALRYICEHRSFWYAFERATRLRRNRQVKTLTNILRWIGQRAGGSITASSGSAADERLADQAESFIRNGIRFVWKRFERARDPQPDRDGRAAQEAHRRAGRQHPPPT